MTSNTSVNISMVSFNKLPHYSEENGEVVVIEGGVNIPFMIARVFIVRAPVGATRGQHAHKLCAQLLICSHGTVGVICTDGINSVTHEISSPDQGLYVPPGIWAEQKYLTASSALTVLCDRKYEANDYIRNYSEYLEYRGILDINGNS